MKINVNYRGYFLCFDCHENNTVAEVISSIASLTIAPVKNLSLIIIPTCKYTGGRDDDVTLSEAGCIDGERISLMFEGVDEHLEKIFRDQWIELEKQYSQVELDDASTKIKKLAKRGFVDNIELPEEDMEESEENKSKRIRKERKLVKKNKLNRIKKHLEIKMKL